MEGDLVVGKEGKGAALLTFTERKTREEIIFKIESKHSSNVVKALEKSDDKRKISPRVQIYYAHPYRSGERGINENNNRLIRRFIPKGTIITDISEEYIKEIENWINMSIV